MVVAYNYHLAFVRERVLHKDEDQYTLLAGVSKMEQNPTYFVRGKHYLLVEEYILPVPADCYLYQGVVRVSNRGLQIASPDYSYLTPFLLCTICTYSL